MLKIGIRGKHKTMIGTARVKNIKKYGLIKASLLEG